MYHTDSQTILLHVRVSKMIDEWQLNSADKDQTQYPVGLYRLSVCLGYIHYSPFLCIFLVLSVNLKTLTS